MEPYALPAQIYAAGLVFLRVGSLVMLMPGVGEGFVPPRIRLSFALLLSLCLAPLAHARHQHHQRAYAQEHEAGGIDLGWERVRLHGSH